MLNSIKNFFLNLNPGIIIQAPSRINLINPLDAVEGDFWMPSVAINGKINPLCAFFYIKEIDQESRLKVYKLKNLSNKYVIEIDSEDQLPKNQKEIRKKIRGENKLVYASINRFLEMSSYFKEKYLKTNIEIGLISTIPLQSGLGGSAAIIIAILYGFAKFFNIYNNLTILNQNEFPINRDIIAEMATKIEDSDLKITAGYGDRYVISRGGLSFCSYYGKLYHKDISKEPLAIYDRIDDVYELDDIPIIICYSGVFHESGNIHGKLRHHYLQKDQILLESYKELAELAWKSRFAIMRRDWELLGKYFKANTKIMNKVMKHVGFKHGIGLANNILIKIIEDHPEVYAAKLTGAGGGGSVFALVNPNKIDDILNYWKNKLIELIDDEDTFFTKFPLATIEIITKFKKAQFFQINIDKKGVKTL
ncbi:MAG: hypothetical protein ACFE9I_05270 [Candidatus Hermodarchaeota archaeon]